MQLKNQVEFIQPFSVHTLISYLNKLTEEAGFIASWSVDKSRSNICFGSPSAMYLAYNNPMVPLSHQYKEFLPEQLINLLGEATSTPEKKGVCFLFRQSNHLDILRALNAPAKKTANARSGFFKSEPEFSASAGQTLMYDQTELVSLSNAGIVKQ